MKASIIKIGNSKGIRIPKVLLEELGLKGEVELHSKNGKLLVEPKKSPPNNAKKIAAAEAYVLSRSALAREWDTPEEDEAWAYLQ